MEKLLKELDLAAKAAERGVAGRFEPGTDRRLYATLRLFQKAGLDVATLDMSDPDNPERVWYDPESKDASETRLAKCIQDGRIYLWFDDYRFMGMITVTQKKRWFGWRSRYTPYFAVPHGRVETGPPYRLYDTALEWIQFFVAAGKQSLSEIEAGREAGFISP